jgi:hypothetical protein
MTPALILFAAAVVIPGVATRAVTTVVNPCPLFRHAGLCVVTKQEQLAELVEQSNLFRFVSRGRVAKFNIDHSLTTPWLVANIARRDPPAIFNGASTAKTTRIHVASQITRRNVKKMHVLVSN